MPKTVKTYLIRVIPQRPAHNDHGACFEIAGATKADAISNARAWVKIHGHYDRHDGPLIYTAALAD